MRMFKTAGGTVIRAHRTVYSVISTLYSVVRRQRLLFGHRHLTIPTPHFGLTLVALLLLVSLAGCRGGRYKLVEIHGKVTTCEGKPATGGKVTFYPIEDPETTGRPAGNPGREAYGVVAEDGTFKLTTIGIPEAPGVIVGRHRVTFEMPPTKRPVLPPGDRANMTPEEIKKNEADFASRPVYAPIPCSDQIEPGEVTVKAAGDTFEFKLPSK